MPLVRVDLIAGKPPSYRRAIGDVVYAAMRQTLNVPENDRFLIVTEHAEDDLIADATYLNITRTEDCVFVDVTLNEGRTLEQKRAFYKAVAVGLNKEIGLRREDVVISLTEVKKENWSFGNGEAQYAMP